MGRDQMERLECDKLTDEYTLRVPAVTAAALQKLSKHWKRKLNERILVTMASVLHDSGFNPSRYLCSDYFERDGDAT